MPNFPKHVDRSSVPRWRPRYNLRTMFLLVTILAVLLTIICSLIPGLWFLATETDAARLWLMRLSKLAVFWRLNIIPYVLVWRIGTFLLIRRWSRHPKVSLCALTGLGGLLLLWGAEMCLRFGWFPGAAAVRTSTGPTKASEVYYMAMTWYHSIAYPLLSSGCWGLVLWSILGWRNNGRSNHETDPKITS
jgi:hypothetical protein